MLTKFVKDRWNKCGRRAGGESDATGHKDASAVPWARNAADWMVDFENKALSCLDAEVDLPDSMKGL